MEFTLPFLMFAVLLILVLLGFPVGFTLAGTALIFAFLGHALDLFYLEDLGFIPGRIFGIMSNVTLMAVPMFIFMGLMLERSGLAQGLLGTMRKVCAHLPASLNLSVVFVGAILAASTGIVGATVVTMTILSLPTMLKAGYDRAFSCGTICAAGTLGQLIPPSIVLVLLGDIMNVDVGDLFMGALLPGVLLITAYALYVLVRAYFNPGLAPEDSSQVSPLSLREVLDNLLPPALLILTVLGSILLGLASPTEAAACGAAGALIIAAVKGKLTRWVVWEVTERTVLVTTMVFTILIGAQFFSVVFRGLSGDDSLTQIINLFEVDPQFILLGVLGVMFVLGFFLDFLEICFIVVPIVLPILTSLGFDPLWLAVLFAINLQTSFLTPPFGFALFYLKGAAPPEVTTSDIYRGIAPFVLLQLGVLVLVWLLPDFVLWLPKSVFSS